MRPGFPGIGEKMVAARIKGGEYVLSVTAHGVGNWIDQQQRGLAPLHRRIRNIAAMGANAVRP